MTVTPPATLLSAHDLRVGYGGLVVIRSVSLSVMKGETVALIGPNGAGKTTLFKALTGEVRSSAGRIRFEAEDVTALPAHVRAGRGMGRTFQITRVFQDLTVMENVIVAIESRHRTAGERYSDWWAWRPSRKVVAEAEEGIARLGLADLRATLASNLSHGDKKRLELALTLALKPKILMLDEPTAGMAPGDRHQIVELIRTLRARHDVAVLMTEHDMSVIFDLADRVLVMNYGEIIAEGTVAEIRNNPMVKQVYLGQEMTHA